VGLPTYAKQELIKYGQRRDKTSQGAGLLIFARLCEARYILAQLINSDKNHNQMGANVSVE
jgi:hypothetical protein